MKVTYTRVWPGAKAELASKYRAAEPVLLWLNDEQLVFIIISLKRTFDGDNPTGDRAELVGKKASAAIYIKDGSASVEISFYPKGQPSA